MVKPVAPDEIAELKKKSFPYFVIETFNELIARSYSGGSATVYQDDAVALIVERGQATRSEIFDKGWLNIEEIYRAEGWSVNYDKPGYNESYRAVFEFRKK